MSKWRRRALYVREEQHLDDSIYVKVEQAYNDDFEVWWVFCVDDRGSEVVVGHEDTLKRAKRLATRFIKNWRVEVEREHQREQKLAGAVLQAPVALSPELKTGKLVN